ncbi:hypothetical protein [Nioella ostreopsis]|uniref:hypothetical protein n=1 Tax=Nioella ostreopsis TaxID=2448479 RepID=UPI0013DFC4AA|nr:hypothetical protein [Nioella ostreopsis]
MTFWQMTHLLCRMLTAFLLTTGAIEALAVIDLHWSAGTRGIHGVEWTAIIVLCALILSTAVWLLVGIRSRAVAMLGAALLCGLTLWFDAMQIQTVYGAWLAIAAAATAVPVALFGGGQFAPYRKGEKRLA